MDNQNIETTTTVASGSRPQRTKSRLHERRSASTCSDSSSTSSSDSSDSSRQSKKKKHRRSKKQKRRERRRIEKLTNDVGELRKTISFYENSRNYRDNDSESCMSEVSRRLYDDYASQASQSQRTENPVPMTDLTFDIETKLKDPSVPITPQEFLKKLDEVQRFGSSTWSDIRYAETQKLYNHSPGFTELETNEEVKAYDNIRHLGYSDKSYAAITFCILKQKEVVLNSLRSLIAWSRTPDASLTDMDEKINDLFLKGDFHKVSTDLLQMACGHRAETIEMRREGILKSVRDPLVRVALNKIPPSNTHIFSPDTLASTLEKSGGVKKTFWPVNQTRGSGNASRAKPTNATKRLPSQGHARYNVPSHGHCCDHPSTNVHCQHNQPSQGRYHSQYYTPKGRNFAGAEQRGYNPPNKGSTFRSHGSKQYQQPQRGQKRHFSPSNRRGNKRQKQ